MEKEIAFKLIHIGFMLAVTEVKSGLNLLKVELDDAAEIIRPTLTEAWPVIEKIAETIAVKHDKSDFYAQFFAAQANSVRLAEH